jgi:cell division protein FtsI/penicillin-binding protein 2
MMEGVVERGTATAARLPGYHVAGKTGTARKVVNGSYSASEYNASFVGFLPSRAPRFTILVVVDTPRTGGYYGGIVAAPIFQKIAAAAVQHV